MVSKQELENDKTTQQPSVGEQLRAAREASGKAIEDIAHDMHMKVSQLEALEKDNYDKLPDAVFIQGYIRGFARTVDVDPEPLLKQFSQSHNHSEHEFKAVSPAAVMDFEPRPHTGWLTWAIVIFTTLLVAALVVLLRGADFFSSDDAHETSSDSTSVVSSPSLESASGDEPDAAVSQPSGSWLSVETPKLASPNGAIESTAARQAHVLGDRTSLEKVLQSMDGATEQPSLTTVSIGEQDELPADNQDSPSQSSESILMPGQKVVKAVPQVAEKSTPAIDKSEKNAKTRTPPKVKKESMGREETRKGALVRSQSQKENSSSKEGGDIPVFVNGINGGAKPTKAVPEPQLKQGVPMTAVFEFVEDSWVKIRDINNGPLLSGLQKAGEVREIKGEGPFQVFLGNAPGVVIKQAGQTFDSSGFVRSNRTARFELKAP